MQVFLLTDRVNNQQCKKIVIDYSSPNIGKQFHIGNLRSTLLGRYLDRVHRAIGNQVISVNYLGDWGTQFAMIATYWPKVRPSDSYWNSCNDVEKIRAITDCYIVANKKRRIDEDFREEVRQTFAEMENKIVKGDSSSPEMRLWNDIRGISERHLKHFYSLFSIDFDRAVVYVPLFSFLSRKTSTGLWTVDLPRDDSEEHAIVQKSNDTTIYLSRELASILHRDDLFHADLYMYVVDRAQRKHFETLRAILSRIGRDDLAEKIEHVPYGRVKGLSTRYVLNKNR
uniref:Probable arginine--tRNA ligase, mitochondrial n=1 Tax=Angiostrongylus cantonensis TaxID=6313 RepID=A0A0K0DEU8_ANGCA